MLVCSVYKSTKKDEMYLYVPKALGLGRVPEPLLNMFGAPVLVTDMMLKPERQLARANIVTVLADLADKGYYLQLPPPKDDYLLDLHNPDDSKYRDSGLTS